MSDPVVAGRQLVTREWWRSAISRYHLVASQLVIDECQAGDPDVAAERLFALEKLDMVQAADEADDLARRLLRHGAIPESEPRDALHIALATVNGIEYLVTWNFKHIANATTRDTIESTCRNAGFEPPTICTPDELSEAP